MGNVHKLFQDNQNLDGTKELAAPEQLFASSSNGYSQLEG